MYSDLSSAESLAAAKAAAFLEIQERKRGKEDVSNDDFGKVQKVRERSASITYNKNEENRADGRDRRDRSRDRSSRADGRDRDRDHDRKSRYRRSSSRENRDSLRSRSRDRRGRDDSRHRERVHVRDRDRDHERERELDRDRDSRSHRDRSRDRDRHRDRERERHPHRASSSHPHPLPAQATDSNTSKPGIVTLTEIMAANPGISILEGMKHLSTYNAAIAAGEPPPYTINMSGQRVVGMVGSAPIGGNLTSFPLASSSQGSQVTIGNLPPNITADQLVQLINASLRQTRLYGDQEQPALSATLPPINTRDSSSPIVGAIVTLRNEDDVATAVSRLNGMTVGTYYLTVQRVNSHIPSRGVIEYNFTDKNGNGGTAEGLDSARPRCVMVTNLTSGTSAMLSEAGLAEPGLLESLQSYGRVNAYNVILTAGTETAVCEFEHADTAAEVAASLSRSALLQGKKLVVQLIPDSQAQLLLKPSASSSNTAAVSVPSRPPSSLSAIPPAPFASIGIVSEASIRQLEAEKGTVLVLSSMATDEDLSDDSAYDELVEDVAEECNKHGFVKNIVIPRGSSEAPAQGRGFVFVQFSSNEGAQAAKRVISNKKFGGSVVHCAFFPDSLFQMKDFGVTSSYWDQRDEPAALTADLD